MTQPETLLEDLFARSERETPGSDGNAWHMAIGALLAFGTLGTLSSREIAAWDERAKAEAARLGLRPPETGSAETAAP